jgi:putative transcriptional regulator
MKKYQDSRARSIHETMEGLYEIGLIDAKRMHEYDEACLVPSAVPHRETVSTDTADTVRSPSPAMAAPRT